MSHVRAFWHGLTQPSLPALVGALLVALGMLVWCARVLDERVIASARFAVHEGDDYAFVAASSLTPTPAGIVLMASSSGREALADPFTLERLVVQHGGVASAPVRLLMAGGLYHLEMLALVERLPVGSSVLGLEVSERNLGLPVDEAQGLLDAPRVPLRSALLDAAVARAGLHPRPVRTEVFFFDQARFFLARPQALLALGRPPPAPLLHQADRMPPPDPAEWTRLVRRVTDWLRRYPENAARNEQLYGELVRAAQARGARVVLIEALRNPWVVEQARKDPEAAAAWDLYRARMPELAQSLGVEWWRLDGDASLQARDFIDYAHLRSGDARYRYTEALAVRLSGMLSPPVSRH